jgi:DNA-3-methyladenine glycosylase II
MLTRPLPLDERAISEALRYLAAVDADLAYLHLQLGAPPLWPREPGFPTLIHIVLEQQVSLASAQATFNRLVAATNPLTPSRLLELDDETLRTVGFSRQKAAYARQLALALIESRLDLERIAQMEDGAARHTLISLKGIGPWTADIYLLMALRRPDVWPAGDLALQIALQQIKELPTRPTPVEMEELAAPWRPWRAVAARLLWHYYLSQRKS